MKSKKAMDSTGNDRYNGSKKKSTFQGFLHSSKQPECETDQLPPAGVKTKNVWSYPSALLIYLWHAGQSSTVTTYLLPQNER